MGNNLKRKFKDSTEPCMDGNRNFGLPSGQVTEREPLTPNLFMRVGMRIGTITAYYEHVNPSNISTVPVNPPAVRIPVIQSTVPLEQVKPIPEAPVYDIPKKVNEPSPDLLPAHHRP